MTGICPRGYYCPEGTKFATEYGCPNGTFNAVEGIEKEDDCQYCPQGEHIHMYTWSQLFKASLA